MSATVVHPLRCELGRPAELHRRRALAALAVGRHSEAAEAARAARRGAGPSAGGALALLECEALMGLLRHADALAVATGAMRRAVRDEDLRARLRVVRAQALWRLGRAAASRAEARRAGQEAQSGLTRARVAEALALLAWSEERDEASARRQLAEARRLYDEAGHLGGVVRTLGAEAGLLRDEGRMVEASKMQTRRIELARMTTRLDAVAQAHGERGELLAHLGRWDQARRDLEDAVDLFRRIGSPREATVALPQRAVVDLARGDLAAARRALDAARKACGDAADPRTLAGHHLLASDVHLAAGEAAEAEAAAAEALRLSRVARDRAGACGARVRRVHALLGLRRSAEAIREGRRAVREAVTPDLGALAWSALGRALLRGGRAGADEAFESASALRHARPAVGPVARLGRALARGAGRGDPEVVGAIEDLERWGDRRLVACALADVQRACGDPAELAAQPPARVEASRTCPTVTALADAVEALQGDGSWPARWRAAMEAVQPALPWFRAAWVSDEASLLARRGEEAPAPLDGDDLARAVATTATQLSLFRVDEHGALRRHPTAALHGLETAAIAPTAGGRALYVDVRPGDGVLGPEALGLLLRLARIMAPHADGDPDRRETPPAAPFPEIVGRSAPMEALFERMRRVARSEASVHIFGATGTGKERVASSLHRHSRRGAGPFVTVNASSLSDELFESEMFGHVKGAFTGAVADRRGHVMAAEGGTLFIDEVADLTPRAQAKLLRFLQDGEYRRVGETGTRSADVRVLTAANVRLAERAAAGLFRQDLMYRLVALTIDLPTLRERGDDVTLLARHFLRSEAAREGRPAPALPAEVARIVMAYAWPGNVRELQNEMRRLVVLAGSGPIRVEHLSPSVAGAASPPSRLLSDARTALERDLIAQTLPMYDGNRSRAACALGISRQALVTKIRQLGL